MNNLININTDDMTVSARELHEALEVKYDFKRWVDSNFKGFVEGEDFNSHMDVKVQVEGNREVRREVQNYDLSVDMAKHLCLMSQTEKGRECRQYLIDLEKAWNTPEQVMARALKVADKMIADLKTENQALIADNTRMKPKEVFADAVTASDSSVLVRDFAKMMRQNGVNIGEKRLYKWFRDNGYICNKSTEPTQRAMEMGLFERIIRTVQKGDGLPMETQTTKISGKGQVYFANKLIKKEEER